MPLTISDKKISLWIAGNQFNSRGFENLVLIKPQFPPLVLDPMPGVDNNPYYFVINIAEDYTQYTLVCNKVTTADGEKGGVLKIAIGIPKNHRIVGGFTSPFDVLAKLREVFVGTYMTPTPGTREAYTYKDDKPAETVFANILNGYNLEETHMVHRPMKGTEPALAVLPPQNIKELFKDVQYQEFTPYKDVVVATFADESAYNGRLLSGIEVPRRPNFTLYVNGDKTPWPVKDIFHDMITLRSKGDERYHNNRSVTFTVNDLMNGKSYRGIKLDLEKEEVRVTLQAEPKKNVYRIDLEGTDNERHRMNKIKISCNGAPLTVMNGQFALSGEEIQFKNTLTVAYDGTDYKIIDKKWYGDTLRITLKATAPASATLGAASSAAASRPAGSPATKTPASAKPAASTPAPQQGASAPSTGMTTVKAVVDSTMSTGYWYLVVECGSANMIDKALRERVTFTRDNAAKGKRTDYVSNPVEIPDTWVNRSVNMYLESDKDSSNSVRKSLVRGENLVTFSEVIGRNPLQKLLPMIVATVIALIVGIVIGYFIGRPSGGGSDVEDVEEEITDTISSSMIEEGGVQAPESSVDPFTLNLDNTSLTFAQVKEAYSKASTDKNSGIDMNKLKALNALAVAVENKDMEQIKKLGEDKESPVDNNILWCVREIYKGWKDGDGLHEYTAQGIDQAKSEFKNGSYASFADLTSLHNGKGEYKKGSQDLEKKEKSKKSDSGDKAKSDSGKKSSNSSDSKKESSKKKDSDKTAE